MKVKKAVIKKQLDVEEGEVIEFIDARLQVEIQPGDKYEDIRTLLHKRLDKRFNEMFAAELGVMDQRQAEGASWVQRGMFEDV